MEILLPFCTFQKKCLKLKKKNSFQITESELSEIAKNCGHIKLPVLVKIIDSIPMTSNGKFKVGELLKQLD